MNAEKPTFEGYALVHMMGHRTVVGYVHEETLFGTALIAIDIPAYGEQPAKTEYYGPSSLYHLEPTNEETVRRYYEPRVPLALPATRPIVEEETDSYEEDEEDEERYAR